MICSPGEGMGCGSLLSQPPVGLIMVGVHVLLYRKARRDEGKGLGSREVGVNARKGHGSMGELHSEVLMVARMM